MKPGRVMPGSLYYKRRGICGRAMPSSITLVQRKRDMR